MAEEKARILRVLEALSQCIEPSKSADIGSMIGESALNAGHDLFELNKQGLAQKPDQKNKLYLITDKGRETLENPPEEWLIKTPSKTPSRAPSATPSAAPSATPSAAPSATPSAAPSEEPFIPSQADLFMAIGERLGGGVRKDRAKDENRAKIGW